MKLHLPSGLRKALLACLAAVALPAATIPTTIASASGIAAVFLIASQRASAEETFGPQGVDYGEAEVWKADDGTTAKMTINKNKEVTLDKYHPGWSDSNNPRAILEYEAAKDDLNLKIKGDAVGDITIYTYKTLGDFKTIWFTGQGRHFIDSNTNFSRSITAIYVNEAQLVLNTGSAGLGDLTTDFYIGASTAYQENHNTSDTGGAIMVGANADVVTSGTLHVEADAVIRFDGGKLTFGSISGGHKLSLAVTTGKSGYLTLTSGGSVSGLDMVATSHITLTSGTFTAGDINATEGATIVLHNGAKLDFSDITGKLTINLSGFNSAGEYDIFGEAFDTWFAGKTSGWAEFLTFTGQGDGLNASLVTDEGEHKGWLKIDGTLSADDLTIESDTGVSTESKVYGDLVVKASTSIGTTGHGLLLAGNTVTIAGELKEDGAGGFDLRVNGGGTLALEKGGTLNGTFAAFDRANIQLGTAYSSGVILSVGKLGGNRFSFSAAGSNEVTLKITKGDATDGVGALGQSDYHSNFNEHVTVELDGVSGVTQQFSGVDFRTGSKLKIGNGDEAKFTNIDWGWSTGSFAGELDGEGKLSVVGKHVTYGGLADTHTLEWSGTTSATFQSSGTLEVGDKGIFQMSTGFTANQITLATGSTIQLKSGTLKATTLELGTNTATLEMSLTGSNTKLSFNSIDWSEGGKLTIKLTGWDDFKSAGYQLFDESDGQWTSLWNSIQSTWQDIFEFQDGNGMSLGRVQLDESGKLTQIVIKETETWSDSATSLTWATSGGEENKWGDGHNAQYTGEGNVVFAGTGATSITVTVGGDGVSVTGDMTVKKGEGDTGGTYLFDADNSITVEGKLVIEQNTDVEFDVASGKKLSANGGTEVKGKLTIGGDDTSGSGNKSLGDVDIQNGGEVVIKQAWNLFQNNNTNCFHGENGTLTVDLSTYSQSQDFLNQFTNIIDGTGESKQLGTFEFRNAYLALQGDGVFAQFKNLNKVIVGENSSLLLEWNGTTGGNGWGKDNIELHLRGSGVKTGTSLGSGMMADAALSFYTHDTYNRAEHTTTDTISLPWNITLDGDATVRTGRDELGENNKAHVLQLKGKLTNDGNHKLTKKGIGVLELANGFTATGVGTIDVQKGSLKLSYGTNETLKDYTVTLTDGATLESGITGSLKALTGKGTVKVTGGKLTLTTATGAELTNLAIDAGELVVSAGSFTISGGWTWGENTKLTLSTKGQQITLSGISQLNGGSSGNKLTIHLDDAFFGSVVDGKTGILLFESGFTSGWEEYFTIDVTDTETYKDIKLDSTGKLVWTSKEETSPSGDELVWYTTGGDNTWTANGTGWGDLGKDTWNGSKKAVFSDETGEKVTVDGAVKAAGVEVQQGTGWTFDVAGENSLTVSGGITVSGSSKLTLSGGGKVSTANVTLTEGNLELNGTDLLFSGSITGKENALTGTGYALYTGSDLTSWTDFTVKYGSTLGTGVGYGVSMSSDLSFSDAAEINRAFKVEGADHSLTLSAGMTVDSGGSIVIGDGATLKLAKKLEQKEGNGTPIQFSGSGMLEFDMEENSRFKSFSTAAATEVKANITGRWAFMEGVDIDGTLEVIGGKELIFEGTNDVAHLTAAQEAESLSKLSLKYASGNSNESTTIGTDGDDSLSIGELNMEAGILILKYTNVTVTGLIDSSGTDVEGSITGKSLTVNNVGDNTSYNGALTLTGDFAKTAAGKLVIQGGSTSSGSLSFSGKVDISGGVVEFGKTTGGVYMTVGGNLTVNSEGGAFTWVATDKNLTVTGTTTLNGTLTLKGGTNELTGLVTADGGTLKVEGGSLKLEGGLAGTLSKLTLGAGAKMEISTAGTFTIEGEGSWGWGSNAEITLAQGVKIKLGSGFTFDSGVSNSNKLTINLTTSYLNAAQDGVTKFFDEGSTWQSGWEEYFDFNVTDDDAHTYDGLKLKSDGTLTWGTTPEPAGNDLYWGLGDGDHTSLTLGTGGSSWSEDQGKSGSVAWDANKDVHLEAASGSVAVTVADGATMKSLDVAASSATYVFEGGKTITVTGDMTVGAGSRLEGKDMGAPTGVIDPTFQVGGNLSIADGATVKVAGQNSFGSLSGEGTLSGFGCTVTLDKASSIGTLDVSWGATVKLGGDLTVGAMAFDNNSKGITFEKKAGTVGDVFLVLNNATFTKGAHGQNDLDGTGTVLNWHDSDDLNGKGTFTFTGVGLKKKGNNTITLGSSDIGTPPQNGWWSIQALVVDEGGITINHGATLTAQLEVNGTSTLVVEGEHEVTVGGVATSAVGASVEVKAASLVLNGQATLSGTTTLSGGSLTVAGANSIISNLAVTNATSSLTINANTTISQITGSGSLTTLTLGAGASLEVSSGTLKGATLDASAGNGSLTLTMSGEGGNLDFTALNLGNSGAKLSITLTGYDTWNADESKKEYQLFNSSSFATLWKALNADGSRKWSDFFNIEVDGEGLQNLALDSNGKLTWGTAPEPAGDDLYWGLPSNDGNITLGTTTPEESGEWSGTTNTAGSLTWSEDKNVYLEAGSGEIEVTVGDNANMSSLSTTGATTYNLTASAAKTATVEGVLSVGAGTTLSVGSNVTLDVKGTYTGTGTLQLAGGNVSFGQAATIESLVLSGGQLTLTGGGTVSQKIDSKDGTTTTVELGGNLKGGAMIGGNWEDTPDTSLTILNTSGDDVTLELTGGDPTDGSHSENQGMYWGNLTLGENEEGKRVNLKITGESGKAQSFGGNGQVTIYGDIELASNGILRFTRAKNSVIHGTVKGGGTLYLINLTDLTIEGRDGIAGSVDNLTYERGNQADPTLSIGGDLSFKTATRSVSGTLTLNRATAVSGAPETVYLLWDSTGQDASLDWATYTGKYAGVTFNGNTGYGIAGDLTISDDATMDKNFKVATGSVTIEGQTTMQQKAVELGDEATLDLKGGVTGTLTKLTLGAGSKVHIGANTGETAQTLTIGGLTWGKGATLDIDSQLTINLTDATLTKPSGDSLLTIDLSSAMLDELGSGVWQLFSGWEDVTNWKDYFTFTIDGQTVNEDRYGNFGLDNGGKLTWEAPENPDLYWTGDAGGDTLTWGGEGSEWSTSSGEEPSVAWPDAGTAGVDVHVAGTEDARYTVDMKENVTANSVEFDGGDYTFQGDGSTLETKGGLTVGKDQNTTVDFGDKQLNVGGNLTLGSGSTATADGELDVAGDVNVGSGTLTANGGGTWGSAQVGSDDSQGSLSMKGTTVTGDVTMKNAESNLSMDGSTVKGALSVEGGNLTVGGESTLGSVSGTLTELEITEGGSLTVQGGNGLAAGSFKWGADSTLSLGSDFTGTLDFDSMEGNSGDLTIDFSSEFLKNLGNGGQLFADVEGFGDGWNNFKFTVDGKDPSDSYGDLKVDGSGCLTWTKSDTPSPEGDTYVSSKDNDPAKPTEWESGGKNIYDSVGDYGQVIVDSNTNIDFSEAKVGESIGKEQWMDDGLTVHNLSGNNANATLTITGGGDNDMVTLKNTGKEKEMTYSGGITVKGAELHINHEDTSSGSLHQGAELGTVMKGELDLSDGLGLYMDRGVLELQNVKNELTDVTFTHGRDGQLIVNGGAATVSGNITVVAEGEAVYTEDKEGKPVTRNHVQLVGGGVLQLVGGDTEEEATTVGAGVAIGAGMGFLGGVVEVKGNVRMEEGSKLNNVLLMLDGEGTVLKVGAGPATAHSLAVEGDAVPTADGGGDAGPTLCGLIMNGGKITGNEDYEFQLNGGSFSTNGGDLSGYDGTMKFESGLFCQVFTRMKGGENWDVTMESGAQVLFDVVNESGMNAGWQMGKVDMQSGSHTTFVFTFNATNAGMQFQNFNLAKDADITFRVDSGSAPTSKKFVIGTYADGNVNLNAVEVAAEAAEADEVAEASELETRVAASELDSTTSRKLDRSQLVGGAWLHVKEATLKAEGGEIYLDLTESDTNSLAEAVQGTHQNAVEGAKALWELTGFNPKAAEAINNPNSDTNKLRNEAQRLLSSGNNADLAKMLAAASGAAYTGYSAALGEDMHRQLTVIRNRTTSMGDEAAQAATDDDMPYWHAWVNAESSFRELDADGLAPGYRLNGWGGTLGVDADISRNTTVGLALTAMYNDLKCTGADSISGDMDTMYATAFVRYMSGRWMHTLVLSEGTADFKTHRTVMTGSGNYTADADTNGYALGALYELGYTTLLQKDARSVMQYVINAEVRYNKIDGFMESGSDAGLSVEDMDSTTLTFGAGARFQSLIGENVYNRSALFESRLLVKVDAGDRRGEAATRFINGSYVTNMVGAEVGVVGVEIGAGITIPLGGGLSGGSFFMDGSVEFRQGWTSFDATTGFRISF